MIQNICNFQATEFGMVKIILNMKKSLLLLLILIGSRLVAQNPTGSSGQYPPPVKFTAEQDHQNMMDQLGIKSLRPGPSGNESAPNHANYDESLATPYPDLPDLTDTEEWEESDNTGYLVETASS